MSKYTFTFKKDDIFVEFITEDKDVIERQFQIWVSAADEYAKSNPKTNKTTSTVDNTKPQETVKKEEKPKEEPKQEIPTPAPIIEKASTLLRTINTIQQEQQKPEEGIKETPVEEPAKADFGSVLDEKIENPTFEPTKTQDAVFMNLINTKQTTDKFHYLMITAYYLSEFEKMEKFSLKQINAKLMQNLSEVIDHAMLQEAINQNFIEIIPDLTGVAEVAEYRITRAGEEFFANQI